MEVTNPFKNIKINPRQFEPTFMLEAAPLAAIAVGLAMRRPGDR